MSQVIDESVQPAVERSSIVTLPGLTLLTVMLLPVPLPSSINWKLPVTLPLPINWNAWLLYGCAFFLMMTVPVRGCGVLVGVAVGGGGAAGFGAAAFQGVERQALSGAGGASGPPVVEADLSRVLTDKEQIGVDGGGAADEGRYR